jgi:hypothetical protein
LTVHVVCLAASDRRLLAARFAEHANSHRRMRGALLEAGGHATVDRLDTLRKLERSFRIDLGSVCHRFDRRDLPETHPIERMVVNYIAEIHKPANGAEELWVMLDRVDEIRELMEGRLVGEPGP